MAEKRKPVKSTTRTSAKAFTDEERAAMQAHAREVRAAQEKDGETMVREKIAEMTERDRTMAEGVHAIIKAHAPELSPRTYYGMPAYATKDGTTICFFQPAQKFKTRYATFGFNDKAKLDEGNMWPIGFALMEWTADVEARIAELVKKAVS